MQSDETLFFQSREHDVEIIYSKNSRIAYPTHTHAASYTLGLVLAGTVQIVRKGAEQQCKADDIFVIPPHLAHSIRPHGECYSLLTVCLARDFVFDSGLDVLVQRLRDSLHKLTAAEIITGEQCDALSDAVAVLYQNLSEAEIGDAGVRQAQRLLQQGPEDPFPLEQLAQAVSISPCHLIRTFKRQLGLTPHQFQIQNRVRKAQHMLDGNANITEVALAAGFCDQSHLDKCFKKIVGMTPSEYLLARRRLP